MSLCKKEGLWYDRCMNNDICQGLIPLLEIHGRTGLYQRGETICRMGDEFKSLMVIRRGRAKLIIHSDIGRALLLGFTCDDEILGDLEYFVPGPSMVMTQAVSDCHVLEMELAAFRQLASNQPHLIELMGRSAAYKLRRSNSKLSVNILYPLKDRLASYLFGLASGQDDDIRGESLMDIADLLGTSYRHLNRVISELCHEQILQRTETGLKIKHLGRLAAIARDIYYY